MSTTNEVRRRPGGRSARVRSAVFTATLEVLAEAGAAGLTIAEVAKRAGVHETSIYRRWSTRERLAVEALSELSAELLPTPDTGTLEGDLVALGRSLAEYGQSPLGRALMRTFALSDDEEAIGAARAEFWQARFDECSLLVTRAITRGELPEGTDERRLLESFVAPIHFRILMTRQAIDQLFLEQLAETTGKAFTA
ncbi:TetR/AcrR family transcriptional regulator [Streptomyces sp. GbtcB6]|uniref:TetR/AcrR family transcriptional regulator n=1 Tax=Streptomyces sp. GbtcB6 TaxID=2824751 RepID=UPI0027E50EF4|nr:TetR/AcrR family transcriptional regulator [Streptomyces sp. GbtcB6]